MTLTSNWCFTFDIQTVTITHC